MAIFHMTARIVSRSGGESAVSTAAYCAGDRLRDFETGRTIDKTKKTEVVFSEILLCKHAPAEFADREKLWNAVEKRESHKNAQLARIFEIALPREIDQKTQIEMVREYILSNFVAGNTPATSGMIADWSLHDKGDGNPHVHMMVTMRGFNDDGSWADYKKRSAFKLDADGNRIPKIDPATGEQAVRVRKGKGTEKLWEREYVSATPWSSPTMMEVWRSAWADVCNNGLEKQGVADRVDHRSFERQGIDRLPSIHEGYYARKIESEGGISDLCQENRIIKTQNHFLELLGNRVENRELVSVILEKIRAIGTSITSIPRMILAISKEVISEIVKFDRIEKLKGGVVTNDRSADISKDGGRIGSGAFRDLIRELGLERREPKIDRKNNGNGKLDQGEQDRPDGRYDYLGREERRDPFDAEDERRECHIDRGI